MGPCRSISQSARHLSCFVCSTRS